MEKKPRSKKFMSTDSLWYEEERLNTFIDWPVTFISADELASNGFYYLRTKDHCACAFCLGIIGAWEEGDSIVSEHKRHFPNCPYINGNPTPNVPLLHGNIIAKLNRNNALSCERQQHDTVYPLGEDVCGTGKEFNPGKNTESGADECSEVLFRSLGLPLYAGPKKKEYLTYDSRLKTFKDWPDNVSVIPQDLADAGFFYIGLSDHVRCFHCGNGLRNWEPNDNAWEEHARWYPECHYIVLKKGTEFVDKITRTKPPYIHAPPNQPSVYFSKGAKYNKFVITDEELSRLMDLQVIKAASEMGFAQNVIKAALKKKLEKTGVPFFKLDSCVEAILQVSQEEKEAVENESLSQQANKIALYENETSQSQMPPEYSSNVGQNFLPSNPDQTSSLPTLPIGETLSSFQQEESVPSTSQQLPDAPPQLDENVNPTVEIDQDLNTVEEVFSENYDEPRNETSLNSVQTNQVNDESKQNNPLENKEKSDILAQADDIIKAAKLLLAQESVSSSAHSSLESLDQPLQFCQKVLPITNADDLTKELEKIKDDRICRVCMDTEMEVVFLPCTHMTACSSCAVTLSKCPICRGNIKYVIKPIIS